MKRWVLVLGVVAVCAVMWGVAQETATTNTASSECFCIPGAGTCDLCRDPFPVCFLKGPFCSRPENLCLSVGLPQLAEYSGIVPQPGLYYNSSDRKYAEYVGVTPLGLGWTMPFYERILQIDSEHLLRVLPCGDRVVYRWDPEDGVYRPCPWYRRAEKIVVSPEMGYMLSDLKTGLTKFFYFDGWLYCVMDANNNTCSIKPDGLTGYPGRVVFPDGRSWVLLYTPDRKLCEIHAEDKARMGV